MEVDEADDYKEVGMVVIDEGEEIQRAQTFTEAWAALEEACGVVMKDAPLCVSGFVPLKTVEAELRERAQQGKLTIKDLQVSILLDKGCKTRRRLRLARTSC